MSRIILLDVFTVQRYIKKTGKGFGRLIFFHNFALTMKTYPLLQSQLGVLLQSMQHPESTQYNLPLYIYMPLQMTRKAVVAVMQKLVDSVPELHTRFMTDEQGEIRQWSDPQMQIPVVSRKCTEDELQAYISDGFVRPFDPLGNEPLFRVEVVETEENICLLSDGYHAIVDGMSLSPILTTAFTTIFEGGSVEPQPYGLYQAADDEAAMLGTEAYQRAKAYYAEKFAGLEMATLSPNQSGTMGQMGRCKATIGRSVCDDWCREHGIQPVLLFQAAFGHVMSVLTHQEKVAFTTTNHGRMDKRLRGSIGMFVKRVPILVNADSSQRVIDFIRSQRAELMSTIRYGIYPFTHFCSDLGVKPGVMFNFMAVKGMEERVQFGGAGFRVVQPVRDEIDSDLRVSIYMKGDDYEIRVESSLTMNDEATLRMVAEAMKVAVTNMMAHPDVTLSELDIVSTDERDALIALGTGKHLNIDPQMTFVKAFEQRARQTPDHLAVVDATGSLTYGELSRRSDVLAQRLIESGVRPGDFVAVMLDRTIAFPLAVIAIHKAGAAYVPIDLEYPEERQKYMLDHCQAKLVVNSQFIEQTDFAVGSSSADAVDLSTPEGLAYMIYTSGSTGRPKGVMIRQASLWNFIQNFISVTEIGAADRVAAHRSFSFDAHLKDIYAVLTQGGSLHIMPERIRRDLNAIRQFITDNRITVAGFTTTLGMLLLDTFDNLPIRLLNVGGERLHDVYSDHIVIVNCYGPTECTDDIFFYRIEPGERFHNVPIGRPVSNGYCFLVDPAGHLVPRGAVGELCFAGVQVSQGYWRQPELTEEKFCDCPFLRPFGSKRPEVERVTENIDGTPVPMYHTGDLCRWNADGLMEYVARKDSQVKLRGFRIEFGEVESCASRFEGIRQAVAVIRELSGSNTLCLYYTAEEPDKTIDTGELRRFMAQTLADYMVPAAYAQLDTLPLTPNGKVDRRRLPDIDDSQLHEDYVAPRNELEKRIVSGFERVLSQERISVNDDFVLLGGDSLSALKLVFSLDGTGITVADVLSLRTPAAIALSLNNHEERIIKERITNKYTIESGCPLNNTQLFIINDIVKFSKRDSYLIPSIIPIDRKYSDEQIRRALDAMFTAHPVLTMHIEMRDGVPFMVKGDKPAVMKGSLNPIKLLGQLTADFDLYSYLSRYVIVRIPGRCYLLSIFHHLIFDIVSNNVFTRHFLRALEGETLDFVDDHFLQVSAFHQEVKSTERFAEMEQYIRAMLSNLTEGHYYRNPGKCGRPGYHKRLLGVSREQVQRFCDRYGVSKNILFTAAMAITLSKLADSDEVIFGFLDNGRDRFKNFEDIGLYITGMPLVVHVDCHDMQDFVAHLSDVYYKLNQNNYFPFGSLVQEFNIAPVILFQFYPDWILENGKYDHLPQNEMIINKVFSTQKDFMVEALTDVAEIGDSYFVRIMYSGYYSRKMMKALAATYKETINEMIRIKS